MGDLLGALGLVALIVLGYSLRYAGKVGLMRRAAKSRAEDSWVPQQRPDPPCPRCGNTDLYDTGRTPDEGPQYRCRRCGNWFSV